jgi:photosystem II stability/assembly factor-like uncharacterized protein
MKTIASTTISLLFIFSLLFLSPLEGHAQWIRTNAYEGNVLSIIVKGNNLYAGTIGGGVLHSSDNGANWIAVNNGLTNDTVTTFAILGNDLFIGTGGSFTKPDGGGVFRSTDNGAHWSTASNGLMDSNVYCLAVSSGILYAGTYGGVFRSSDSGVSWVAVNNGLTNTDIQALAISGDNLFAGTYGGGVFRSTDSGTNWDSIYNGLTNKNIFSLAVNGSDLFTGTHGGGVFQSTDNGVSWSAFNNGLFFHGIMTVNAFFSFVFSNNKMFAGTNLGVYITPDSGANWSAANDGLYQYAIVRSIALSNDTLFAATDSGVWRRPLSEMLTTIYERSKNGEPVSPSLLYNYPNPFTTSTHIVIPQAWMNAQRISITDMLGKEVAVFPRKSFNNIEWRPDSSIPTGTYFLVVQTPTAMTSKPIVLLR